MSTITKQNYVLRIFQESDLYDLNELMCDQYINSYLPGFTHNTLLDTEKYITEMMNNQDCFYVIEDTKSEHVIGYMRLFNIDEWHIHGELEYALLKIYWNKEIICEVFDDFIVKIKKQHFKEIYVKNNHSNKRSERVLEKVGMVYTHQSHELWKPKNIIVLFNCYKLELYQDNSFIE